jgi:hemin uptake protein HemP
MIKQTPYTPSVRIARPRPRILSTPRWISQDIFSGATEVEIEHQGAIYRLRQTAQGKLILTK